MKSLYSLFYHIVLMHRRKIQLVAGTTYTVSLPKEWVKKNHLKEKNEIALYEKNDETLVISAQLSENEKMKEISLDADKYASNIDRILFAVYYMGVETINLFSKIGLSKDVKSVIRKTLTHMSGTEISYEDKRKITIKVLLDKSKIDIMQVLYRIYLLLDTSLLNVRDELNIEEIRLNENEIDRLYHLTAKVIMLSLTNSDILHSSKIKNVSLVPSYFLLSKRFENLGDSINHLSKYMDRKEIMFSDDEKKVIDFLRVELYRSIKHVMRRADKNFEKADAEQVAIIKRYIKTVENKIIRNYLQEMLRHVIDIEDEIINISFYNQLDSGIVNKE